MAVNIIDKLEFLSFILQILSKLVICCGYIAIFLFFLRRRWAPPWIFEIAKLYWLMGSRWWRCISLPNIVIICQLVAKLLRFFKMAAVAVLDFQICGILLADGVWRAQMHRCAKFS